MCSPPPSSLISVNRHLAVPSRCNFASGGRALRKLPSRLFNFFDALETLHGRHVERIRGLLCQIGGSLHADLGHVHDSPRSQSPSLQPPKRSGSDPVNGDHGVRRIETIAVKVHDVAAVDQGISKPPATLPPLAVASLVAPSTVPDAIQFRESHPRNPPPIVSSYSRPILLGWLSVARVNLAQ